ncbi:unnamed protein product [Meloidogyne enterolobii]|uniref:Uncharacterized protein n=1 Tax=Meloidogyne enterolobii TaxID=390850 RepID=A0ACB0ZSA0_MELEN
MPKKGSKPKNYPTPLTLRVFADIFFLPQNVLLKITFSKQKVINLSENCPRPTSLPDDLQHFLRIPVNDTYSAKLLPHFDSAYQFIETAKQEGEKVLIHCLAGISRSPTVAIAYVMRSRKMTNDEAYNFVKCRRPTISPNFNFLGQLFEYERILRQQNILPFNSSISSSPPKLSSPQNEELNEIKKKLKENLKNPNLQHKPSLPLNSSLPPTTMARPKHLLTSKEDLKNFRHSCPSTTSISFLFKSPLPNSPIPSPSNEFSKLDISFSNPCFGLQKMEEQKIPPPPLPQPPPSHPPLPLPSSCDNKLKPKIISSIENPVFDIPIKIKTLSKIKEATINSKEEKKKTKKERKQINSHEPSFVSFLEKEEKLEFSGYKNSLSTRECLADTEGDELIKFGPSPEFGITPITFDKINEEENELTNKKKRKGKIISKSSLKSTNLIKETNNNKQQQQTKIKLYSNQFANATISSIQNLYKKLPQPPTTLLNNYFNENQKFQTTTSSNIPKSSSSSPSPSSSCCNHRLFPQFGCRKRNNSDLIQQQKCIQCRKYSFKKSPLPTINDDEKSDEEVEEVKDEKKEKEEEGENKGIIYSKII